ncbi:MAG: thiolase family protein [Coprococcus sp.]|uniref:thiolase family protein n=1 Tax=Coprococcus catus TaxID=116085 RepID=UPI001D06B341|nr:thiolase family protein [Coprococcus catus]MCB6492369.1 thiolase family protein [Coprococcus catus]
MKKEFRDSVILSAVRTPVVKAKGALAELRAEQLGKIAVGAAVDRSGINPDDIEMALIANVNNLDLKSPGKYITLDLGYPTNIVSYNIEHGCGSSLTAAGITSMFIENGCVQVALAGGVEHSSTAVYMMDRPTSAYSMIPPKWCTMKTTPPSYENLNMGETAERIAQEFGITRRELDEFSVLSHKRAAAAWEQHFFDEQIVPVTVPVKKGTPQIIDKDDIFRPDCSVEALGKLRPSFTKDGLVTAGNSSPYCDGSAAIVQVDSEYAKSNNLTPLGRIVDYTAVGVQPQIMGIGPAYAVEKLLKRTNMTLDDIDLIELNEAFASQSIACIRKLNLDIDKVNVNGGAIALGHPFAATGAILITKMLYELKRRDKQFGIVCFCIGGGQGVAALIERL